MTRDEGDRVGGSMELLETLMRFDSFGGEVGEGCLDVWIGLDVWGFGRRGGSSKAYIQGYGKIWDGAGM